MTNRNIILNELNEIESTLGNLSPQNLYAVPYGYFEGLPARIMARIQASETGNAKEELEYLSPLLGGISKEMPYSVPAGFFQNFADGVMERVNGNVNHKTSEEEIAGLSPLLSGLKNRNPYSVPAGYFDTLETIAKKKETKVISIAGRRWYRLAVAAIVIGIVAVTGLLLMNDQPNVMKDPQAWIKKNVNKKVSQDKIDELVKLVKTDATANISDEAKAAKEEAEIKEMMKDIPEKEIEDFLNDAVVSTSNDDLNALMN
jgi:hypothetical protein